MRKIFLLFLTVTLGLAISGCIKYDDTEIKGKVSDLSQKVSELTQKVNDINGQVVAMKTVVDAWKDGGYVVSVDNSVAGQHTITFDGGKKVVLYDGAKGDTPDITVKKEGDDYFWYAGDTKLGSAALLPSFSVNDKEELVVTIDGKETNLGKVKGENGAPGDSFFKDVKVTEGEKVTFTLADNSSFDIPFAKAFKLVIENPAREVTAGEDIKFPYTVQSANESTTVDAFASGNYTVKVEADVIVVTAPTPVSAGQVLVWAQNGEGLFSMVKLSFIEKAEFQLVTSADELTAIPADANVFEMNMVSNVDPVVEVADGVTWVKAVLTKAEYKVNLTFEENTTGAPREATINVKRADNGALIEAIRVVQLAEVALPMPDAAPGEVLWAEDWTDGITAANTSDKIIPEDYNQKGTTVFGGYKVFYTSQKPASNGSDIKLYFDDQMLANVKQANLLLSKNGGIWTISGIPSGNAKDLVLTYKLNGKRNHAVTSATEGVTMGERVDATEASKPYTYSYPITLAEGVKKFSLTFTCSDGSNIRIDDVVLKVAGGETPVAKVLKVEKLWEKLSTASENWFEAIGGAAGADFNIAIDDKNVYIPVFGGSKKLLAVDIATGATVKEVNTSTVESVGFDGSIFLSCARVVKKNDGTPVLLATNLFQDATNDATGRLYIWDNGVDAAPRVATLQQWSAGRRLGDTWTTYGNYEDCWMIMSTQAGADNNGFVTFRVPTGASSYLISRLATNTSDFCSFYPFPGDITKGMFAWRGGSHDDGMTYRNRLMTIASTETAIKTEGKHDATLTKLDKWMGNAENNNGGGFNYFEFNGKRYVAWVINMVDDKTFDIVIKEGEASTPWETIINTPAADITSAGGFAFRESLSGGQATTWKKGTDCAVWNNGDEVYIAVNKVNVGLAVYKMYMADAE